MAIFIVKSKTDWYWQKFIVVGILLLALNGGSDGYSMQYYCDEEFSFITKGVHQIQLKLDDNFIRQKGSFFFGRGEDCETRFEAWYTVYPKFMFYFEHIDLDCDDGHLEFFIGKSGKTRVSGLLGNICGNNKPHGVFTVDKRYFRIKYVPNRSRYISDIFSIIITAYGDGYCPTYAHKCENSRCIDEDLACNGFNSCGDDSGCNISTAAIVGIVVGSLAGLGLVIGIIFCCIYCIRKSGAKPGTVQSTASHTVTYTARDQTRYSQPIYGVSQGTAYNASLSPGVVSMPTNVATTVSSQQSYSHPMYGVNQGLQYPRNSDSPPPYSSVSSGTENSKQQTRSITPPPQYSEIVENSVQDINHS
ncbi:uncharacterized protein LOC123549381 [Mercenaria mercenaria]|uniref:uncharacterized protein LOC123549381 n=1 Tax=Mercenaria mercenaria TaxID=6596 RepID=UPI00234F605D|nr:uncharacterized protein LOC123549381 [Mercenaria mercenaria]